MNPLTATPDKLRSHPPYHAEHFPIGSAVCNALGYNCLQFPDKPGAKFTTKERAENIAAEWNKALT